jgi:DNA-binding MarR family transcriptional regulator
MASNPADSGKSGAARGGARAASPKRGAMVAVRRSNLGPMGKLDDFIPYKMSVVANRVSQSIGRLFEEKFNLQIPEWRILMALYAYGDLVFNEVVDRTSMDKARVSRGHRRLMDLGMIQPVDDPNDARKLILSLTPKGEKMCTAILPEVVAREAWFLAALEPHEQRQLDVILDKLMRRSMEL